MNRSDTAHPQIDTAALARFVTTTDWDALPQPVVHDGRLLLLDTLGALLGGLRYPPVRALGARLGTRAGAGDPAPFGRLVTLGTAATWLDADSGGSFHPQGARLPPVPTAHPAPHALPVLLHAAATGELTDREVLRIFVLATEIGLRLGVGTSLRPGLHPHGIHGPSAASVAASLLAGADERATAAALELATALPLAAMLAVPMAGGTVRNVWTGLGAYYGAASAGWARDGLDAGPAVMSDLSARAVCTDLSLDEVGGALGERWQVRNSYLKPYACARWIHPALDALMLALAQAPEVDAAQIAAIDVDTFAFAASLDAVAVDSDMQARFSVPRCVASFAIDRRLDADAFLPGALERGAVESLAGRVRLHELPEFTGALPRHRPSRVTVRLADGRELRGEVDNARGNPDSALSATEVAEKFRRNCGPLLAVAVTAPVEATLAGSGRLDGTSFARLAHAVMAALADDATDGEASRP